MPSARGGLALARRTCGDVVLCGVTLAELSLLVFLTPTFIVLDEIYVLQSPYSSALQDGPHSGDSETSDSGMV